MTKPASSNTYFENAIELLEGTTKFLESPDVRVSQDTVLQVTTLHAHTMALLAQARATQEQTQVLVELKEFIRMKQS